MSLRSLRLLPVVLLASLGWLSFHSQAQAEVSQVTVEVGGMTCPFCSFGVAKRLKQVSGVDEINVDTDLGLATVSAAAGQSIDPLQIPKAVKSAGFTPGAVRIVVTGRLQSEEGQMYLHLRNQEQILQVTDVSAIPSDQMLGFAQGNTDVEVIGLWSAGESAGETDGLAEIQLEELKAL